jgi:hypothetical protein
MVDENDDLLHVVNFCLQFNRICLVATLNSIKIRHVFLFNKKNIKNINI